MTSLLAPERKRPVNVTLSESLVAEARAHTSNLSATIESLLCTFVAEQRQLRAMNPVFHLDGIEVVLHPLDMVSVATEQLGAHIGSLAEHGQAITDALDELLTRC